MATDGPVRRWNSVAYSAADERRLDSVLAMPGAASAVFSVRGGRRVNGAGLAVTITTGPESATVTAGAGIIYDATYAAGAGWEFALPASKAVALAARPGTGTSRIDLVIARIYDVDSSVGSVRELKIEVVTGIAGATPSAPALPALSFELARLAVPNSGTITVTSSTARTVAAGGILPVSTTAERDALVTAGVAYPGLTVFNTQTGAVEYYTSTGWQTVSAGLPDTGWVACTPVSPFAGVMEVRKVGKQVTNRGYVSRASGSATTFVTAMTLPTGFAPSVGTQLGAAVSSAGILGRVQLLATGEFQITMSGATTANINVGGQSWYTD